jgi:hypothetical protein
MPATATSREDPQRRARSSGRPSLLKRDHPRAIDSYVDYFGERHPGQRRLAGEGAHSCAEEMVRALIEQGGPTR